MYPTKDIEQDYMIYRIYKFFSVPRVSVCVLIIFSAALTSSSQTNSDKTATISGKVTLKNKGVAGVIVFAQKQNVSRWEIYRGTTDQTGNYRISKLRAGTYEVTPMAPSLAFQDERRNDSVVVSDGENVDGINFSMVQGGVITGKVSDADGRPIIEAMVAVMPTGVDYVDRRLRGLVSTDDRGIYRAYGLRPGKYRVSVGAERPFPTDAKFSYRQTFYPSVTDADRAKLIEVTEGSETKDVDVVVGRPIPTFKVSGRIVDTETGKPLPNIKYGLYRDLGGGSSQAVVGRNFSNSNGEFSFDNMLPGKYSVFIVTEESGVRGESVPFEVVDRDIVDLVINAGKAATLSGFVVFEGAEESATAIKPNELFIEARDENTSKFFGNASHTVNPDGSFRIEGLKAGRVVLNFTARARNDIKPVDLVRIERDGVVQTNGLILKDGEQVTGLRLVAKYLTGAIHGQIVFEGDESIPASRLSLWIVPLVTNRTSDKNNGPPSPQLDSRNHFVVDGLAAGTYELNVGVYDPGQYEANKVYKQQVTVTDNAVSDVTITIKNKP